VPNSVEGSDNEVAGVDILASKKPIEVTADDLVDEEWGPANVKGKKAKKAKGKKGKVQEDSDREEKGK
jgi:translation initiation factor 5B